MQKTSINSNHKKLVVFPSCTLKQFYLKGEVKTRYYNPANAFDEVHFITLSPQGDEVTSFELDKIRHIVGNAKIFVHPLSTGLGINFLFALPRIWREVCAVINDVKPICVRAYSPYVEGVLGLRIAKRFDIPFILSLHTGAGEEQRLSTEFSRAETQSKSDRLMEWAKFLVKKSIERYVLKNAECVLPVSNYLTEYALTKGASQTKIVTIYNKVYVSQYQSAASTRSKNSKPLILSVGSFISRKNQELLIYAIQDLDVLLQLIGNGPRKRELQDLCCKLDVDKKVQFIDSVDNSQISKHYLDCDIVAVSSHYEGFGIPVLEGMAAAKPVVANDIQPFRELLAECGILVEKSSSGFENAFRKLIGNPTYSAELGKQAYLRAVSLDGNNMEQKEFDVYRDRLFL